MPQRRCESCGRLYYVRGGKQRWCTPACRFGTTDRKPVHVASALRTCERCGGLFVPVNSRHRWCTPTCRYAARLRLESELYGRGHRKTRAQVKLVVDAGQALCARCHLPIIPGEPWDLDHAAGGGYLGPSHARCNRGEPMRRRKTNNESRRWFDD